MTESSPPGGSVAAAPSQERLAEALAPVHEALQRFEARLARLEARDRTSGSGGQPDPRLEKLRTSVEDLANDSRDQRAQLMAVLETVEGLQGSGLPEVPLRAVLAPVPASPFPEPRSLPRRALSFLLRKTLGTLRRLWQASHTPPRIQHVVKPGESVARPSLSVFVDRQDITEGWWKRHRGARIEWVVREGEGRYVVLGGEGKEIRRGQARDAAQWREAASGDLCLRLGFSPDELPATLLETAALILAGESLLFLHLRLVDYELLLVRQPFWHPEEGLDPKAFHGYRTKAPVLGKAVSLGSSELPGPPPVSPALHGSLGRVGRYFVPPRRWGTLHQPLLDLDGLAPEGREEGRRALGVLLTTAPVHGVERLLTDLAQAFGKSREVLVFVAGPAEGALIERRWRELERCGARIYRFFEALPTPQLGAAVDQVLGRFGAYTLLHVGDPQKLAERIPDAGRRFAGRNFAEVPLPEPGSPAAPGHRVPFGVFPEAWIPAPELDDVRAVRQVRGELGLPDDAVVVTSVTDLVPAARPEDFVALAHRFRDDPSFSFLLVGDGPLAGSVESLVRHFRLRHFRHRLHCPDLPAVLAASDVFCSTAESEPLPYVLLSALATGRPVVAAAVDGLDELVGEGPCGRVVAQPGHLPDLERALRELADPAERRACGERGRRRFEERLSGPSTEAWQELLETVESGT